MMRIFLRALALVGAVCATGLFAPQDALAFEYADVCNGQPTRWSPPNTTWQWSTNFPSNDITASTARSVIGNAFNEWAAPGCSSFNPTQGATTTVDPGGSSNLDVVGFYESGWPSNWGSSTLAITLFTYSPSDCRMSGSDMVFNGVHHEWATNASGYDVDLQAVATHEAGHWSGLDHSNHSGSSLWPSWSGTTGERTLSCDDTEAVCGAHNSGGNSCNQSYYCACGVGCSNGTCNGTVPVDPGLGACTGAASNVSESEPNDWDREGEVDFFQPGSTGDFTISGTITCGNNGEDYTADADWTIIDFDCSDDARFTLDWTGSADLDFYVFDTSGELFAGNNEGGTSGPTTDDASAGGRIYTEILCWEGSGSIPYTFKVDWEPFAGTNPTDPCEGLTWEGECQGDTARWCEDDAIREYDCGDEGGCGLTEEWGYWCLGDGVVDPGTDSDTDTDSDSEVPWIPGCGACSASGTPLVALWAPLLLVIPAVRRRR